MLIAVLLGGWIFLVDSEFVALGKHILGGVLFVYNYVAQSESGYFGGDTALKLIHHLWSLAIEEQFYWIFPLLLVGSWRFFKSLFIPLSIFILFSFIYNISQISFVPRRAFYFPEYRFWELGVGGLLAFSQTAPHQLSRPVKNAFALLSLGLILWCAFHINGESMFPGYWALFPVLGSAGLLSFAPGTWMGGILSLRPMRYIGLISYPLYLWHWPLYSFANYLGAQNSAITLCSLIAVSFLLAAATYRWLETRVKEAADSSRVVARCVAIMASIGVLAGFIFAGKIPTLLFGSDKKDFCCDDEIRLTAGEYHF